MKLRLFAAIILLVSAGIAPAAAAQTTVRSISVSGTAKTYVSPDSVFWRIGLIDYDKYLPRAKANGDQKLKLMLEEIGKLGVKSEDVESGRVKIEREYDYDQYGNQMGLRHYVVTRSLTVRQRSVDRFDALITKLISVAEIEVSFELDSAEVEKVRTDTHLRAVREAREKAKTMAGALNAKLGRVLEIVEKEPPSDTFHESIRNPNVFVCLPPGADWKEVIFSPPAIGVSTAVQVTFEIE